MSQPPYLKQQKEVEQLERRERKLQTVVFVGAMLVLALVLTTSSIVQNNRRERETAATARHSPLPTTPVTEQPLSPPTPPARPTQVAYPLPPEANFRPDTLLASEILLDETVGVLDPLYTEENGTVQATVFLGLWMHLVHAEGQPSSLSLLPTLLRSWEIRANGLHYTLHLRNDVYWVRCDPVTHVSEAVRPVTADDIIFALERALKSSEPAAHGLRSLEISGLAAPDPFTLRIDLARTPQSMDLFLSVMASPVAWPLPREAIEEYGDEWTQPGKIWISGGFCPIAWNPEQRIALVVNPWLPEDLWPTLNQHLLPLPTPTPKQAYPNPENRP